MTENEWRLYGDLAWLWPLWEDVSIYEHETELYVELIKNQTKNDVRTVLDIGCGGGKHSYWLKKHFTVTGIDISEAMLSNAKKLNPECEFLYGDMRDFDLDRQFDSIFLNDSILHMANRTDLTVTFQNAYRHLKTGGIMICFAEYTRESFQQNATSVSRAQSRLKPPNLEITFIENLYDPDPEDDCFEYTLLYLIRESGRLTIEQDTHYCGLFPIDFWRYSLDEAGFQVSERILQIDDLDLPTFACLKV
ncbi:class I SAM-dependent methyltransferase [Acidobacteriota bacterium]